MLSLGAITMWKSRKENCGGEGRGQKATPGVPGWDRGSVSILEKEART